MPSFRSLFCFGVATANLLASACSFQDFDYLKDAYHPSGGGAAGKAAGGSTSGAESKAGDTSAGSGGTGGSGDSAGRAGAVGQGGMPSGGAAGEAGASSEAPGTLLNGSFELGDPNPSTFGPTMPFPTGVAGLVAGYDYACGSYDCPNTKRNCSITSTIF